MQDFGPSLGGVGTPTAEQAHVCLPRSGVHLALYSAKQYTEVLPCKVQWASYSSQRWCLGRV